MRLSIGEVQAFLCSGIAGDRAVDLLDVCDNVAVAGYLVLYSAKPERSDLWLWEHHNLIDFIYVIFDLLRRLLILGQPSARSSINFCG